MHRRDLDVDGRRAEGAKLPRAPDHEGASAEAAAGAGADMQCPPQLRGGAASRRPRPQTSSFPKCARPSVREAPPPRVCCLGAVALGNSDNGKSFRQPESVLQVSGVVVLKTPLCFNCRLVKSLWPHALCPDASPWFHIPTLPFLFQCLLSFCPLSLLL